MIKSKDIAVEIQKYLEINHKKIIDFLKDLVRMESPSGEIQKQHEILQFLQGKFEAIGYKASRIPGKRTGGYLYARQKQRNKAISLQLLIGHCDTVWPTHTIDAMPLIDKKGTIKGPGVYDMKAGLTQIYFSLMAIKDLSIPLPLAPIVLINSDEEIGSRESTPIIKRLSRIADRAYVLEPPLGVDGKLKTARKGLGRFTITITGKAAHAGIEPEKGINAIVELSHQVQQLYAMNDFNKGITVNVGMIEGGISPNMVAPQSKAVVDVRVMTEVDGIAITDKIMGMKPHLPNVQIHIEGGMGRPPMQRNPRNQKLWEMAHKQGRRLGIELEQATAGGGSDGNTTSIFTATLDGLGAPGDGAHAAHEYILENKLIERTALLALLLLANPLEKAL